MNISKILKQNTVTVVPNVAFMFDVDGVLVRSHELQAEALHETLRDVIAVHCPETSAPSPDKMTSILVGGTEASAITAIIELVPKLSGRLPTSFAMPGNATLA